MTSKALLINMKVTDLTESTWSNQLNIYMVKLESELVWVVYFPSGLPQDTYSFLPTLHTSTPPSCRECPRCSLDPIYLVNPQVLNPWALSNFLLL